MDEESLMREEVRKFDSLVKKRSDFDEEQVFVYGTPGKNMLSSLCRVPEGIKFEIDSKVYVFDTTEHIHLFLCYGCKNNIEKWIRGSVMSSFVDTFGDDNMEKKYGDMIGIIPQLLIKSNRSHLRAAHGIEITDRPQLDEFKMDHFDHWRPILHAKFSSSPTALKALMETGDKYLIDKENASKIVYASKKHPRKGGSIQDPGFKNRYSKYLMAIRSEITLIKKQGKY